MFSVIGILLSILFAVWFLISIVAQFREEIGQRFPKFETLGLIPRWTFFAPRPSVHDMHLLYRDRLENGQLSKVSVVSTINHRRWYHCIWNPSKSTNKVVVDVSLSLGRQFLEYEKHKVNPRLMILSIPYLMALHLVMRQPRLESAIARQFIVARSQAFGGGEERQIIMTSEFHAFK